MEFNLADIFESLADKIPESLAVVCGDRRITYGDLDARANRLARHWAGKGIGTGDHIGLVLYNRAEFIECMIAAFKIRAVPINVNYRYVAHELHYIFDNADLVGLVFEAELAAPVADALDGMKVRRSLLSVNGATSVPGAETFEAALAASNPERNFGPRSSDDRHIVYTGGTTGMPRGVVWRHEDLFYGLLQGGAPGGEPCDRPEQVAENVDVSFGGMNIVPAAPLIHGSSMFASWIAMFTGGIVGLIPGRSYDAEKMCDLAEDISATVIALVGDAMLRPLVDVLEANPDRWNLEELSVITSQGAIMSGHIRVRLSELLPDAMLLNNFGTTESGHQGEAYYEEDEADAEPQWMLNERTMVVDEHMQPVEPGSGQVGKLATSGPIPVGYYNDPEKTAATFFERDGKRWVVAGDMATVDEMGIMHFLGRGSGCINTGGEKVFPEEVEEALKSHPSVFDALVIGVADARWGQRVEAVLSLRNGADTTADQVEAACRELVAGYKVPRGIHIVADVPRHPSGKPDYKAAKRIAEGEAS